MPDEQLELPLEVFDRKIKWPKGNDKMRAEELSHPGIIPDTPDGPFKDWIKEKLEDEEIGYEGER